jgi:hypothetical protein
MRRDWEGVAADWGGTLLASAPNGAATWVTNYLFKDARFRGRLAPCRERLYVSRALPSTALWLAWLDIPDIFRTSLVSRP